MQQILLVSFSNSPNFQNELFCRSPKIFLIYIKSKDNHILSNLITPDSLAYSAVHLMCSRKRASYNIRGSIIAFCGAYIQSTSTDTI